MAVSPLFSEAAALVAQMDAALSLLGRNIPARTR